MNDKIVDNEPGCEKTTQSVAGLKENEAYANIVRIGNLQYAMIDMIKNPPPCFKDVVLEYFKLKGSQILEDIKLWLERSKVTEVSYSGMASQNDVWCQKLSGDKKIYENIIINGMDELKELIKSIK